MVDDIVGRAEQEAVSNQMIALHYDPAPKATRSGISQSGPGSWQSALTAPFGR
jgi:hypothetical protein